MRKFGLYWARIEGNRLFGDIGTADLYVVRVCEISFFLSEILMNFAYPYKEAESHRLKELPYNVRRYQLRSSCFHEKTSDVVLCVAVVKDPLPTLSFSTSDKVVIPQSIDCKADRPIDDVVAPRAGFWTLSPTMLRQLLCCFQLASSTDRLL